MHAIRFITTVTIAIMAASALASDPQDDLREFQAACDAIQTLDVRVVVTMHSGDTPPREMSVVTWRKDGLLERHDERHHSLTDAEGRTLSGGDDVDRAFGYDEEDVRVLMSPDMTSVGGSKLFPGDPAYTSTKCSITPRDPVELSRPVYYWLRFSVTPIHTVETLLSQEKVLDRTEDEETVRLNVHEPDFGFIRMEFDKTKGFLLRRTEFRTTADQQEPTSVAEIEEFSREEDVWFPKRVSHGNSAGKVVAEATQLIINQPIDRNHLVVRFPEGARVDEPVKGLIHVWGKENAPASSFQKYADYVAAEESRGAMRLGKSAGKGWLLWFNLVGCSLILGALLLRKRLKGTVRN